MTPGLVYLASMSAKRGHWFLATADGRVWSIAEFGTEIGFAIDALQGTSSVEGEAMFIWATDRVQVVRYLRRTGHTVGELEDVPSDHDALIESARRSLARATESASQHVEAAARRLERLLALPPEPQPTEDSPYPVITFGKTFRGRSYQYAAMRSAEGRWSTTGPKSPKDYSWSELIRWILDDEFEVDIRVAKKWKAL